MSTFPNQGGNPLAADRDDSRVADLQAAFLRARVRDTTVRLSLAMFRARGYAEVWGMDAEARAWESNAERIRADLAELTDQMAAVGVVRGLAA
jgi:hypothetical protein